MQSNPCMTGLTRVTHKHIISYSSECSVVLSSFSLCLPSSLIDFNTEACMSLLLTVSSSKWNSNDCVCMRMPSRRFLEPRGTQGAAAGGAACEGPASHGGPHLGLLWRTGVHHQHRHTHRRGTYYAHTHTHTYLSKLCSCLQFKQEAGLCVAGRAS